MNQNTTMAKKLEQDKKRNSIKKMLHNLNSSNNKSFNEKINDLYQNAVNKFLSKGYSQEDSEKKALAGIGLFIPEGFSVGIEDGKAKIFTDLTKEAKS